MKKTPFLATAGIVFRFTRRRCYRALTVALAGLFCTVSGPTVWNSLPAALLLDMSLTVFRAQLKTFLMT